MYQPDDYQLARSFSRQSGASAFIRIHDDTTGHSIDIPLQSAGPDAETWARKIIALMQIAYQRGHDEAAHK